MAAKRMVAGGARAGEIVVVRLAYGELLARIGKTR